MIVLRKFRKAMMVLLAQDSLWFRALRHGVAPSLEHVSVLSWLKPAMIVDIGANRGQFALAARHACPNSNIVSFEPLSEPAEKFKTVLGDDRTVSLYESAIGTENGHVLIHVSAQDDSSSLLPISDLQNQLFPGTSEKATCNIRVGRLSNFLTVEDILTPALLKLDVQGFELQSLKGCEDLLDAFKWIYVECSFVELYEGQPEAADVLAWLNEGGWKLSGVYNMSYDKEGRAIQADFLLQRK